MFNYTLVENKQGFDAIKLLDKPFAGIIYSYGRVAFDEDVMNDSLKLSFEYEIHKTGDDPEGFDKVKFEMYIGKLLEELIHEGVEQNSITYTGGVDSEN